MWGHSNPCPNWVPGYNVLSMWEGAVGEGCKLCQFFVCLAFSVLGAHNSRCVDGSCMSFRIELCDFLNCARNNYMFSSWKKPKISSVIRWKFTTKMSTKICTFPKVPDWLQNWEWNPGFLTPCLEHSFYLTLLYCLHLRPYSSKVENNMDYWREY